MENGGSLSCPIIVEWCNLHGETQRKINYKKANLRLGRNESKSMYLEISGDKAATFKLALKGITVHKKFMNEGKASIKFQEERCSIYISNAPPAPLFDFLRTLFIKMTGTKAPQPNSSLRNQLLTNKPKQFDEISPVTIADLDNVKKISKSTDTTPSPLSRKRKLEGSDTKGNAAKKLYMSSHSFSIPLNTEQQEVLDACLTGQNIFFTGSAGTGKSYLLRQIIGALPPDVTVATASTGVAACHIGGITLHQFAGIGKGDASLERCFDLASRPASSAIWRRCKHLIIDEISMIEGDYFQKVEETARKVRRNDKPFGGIQIIVSGDFLQLPPVTKFNEKYTHKFCFQTKAWNECIKLTFELRQVHRQTDIEFINILNKIRIGNVPQELVDKLLSTSNQKIEQNGILATRLCSHTKDAHIINESKLNELDGETKSYKALDSDSSLSNLFDQQTPVPGNLVLKINAQVMLLRNINISEGLVNGARGVIKGFREGFPVVQFRKKTYLAKPEKWSLKTAGGNVITRKQVPLKLAWAFSIHKSQGLTLDCVEMSLARVFEAGQAYVALSRAQSLHALRVLDFKASQVWADPDVLDFYKTLRENMEDMALMRPIPLGRKNNGVPKKIKSAGKRLFSSKPIMIVS